MLEHTILNIIRSSVLSYAWYTISPFAPILLWLFQSPYKLFLIGYDAMGWVRITETEVFHQLVFSQLCSVGIYKQMKFSHLGQRQTYEVQTVKQSCPRSHSRLFLLSYPHGKTNKLHGFRKLIKPNAEKEKRKFFAKSALTELVKCLR